MLKDLICDEFQHTVSKSLIYHRSILDILSKYQQANANLNRDIIKAVTDCGCLEIKAKKQAVPGDPALSELKQYFDTHLSGNICDKCLENIEDQIGHQLFYMAAICNLLGLNLYDIFLKKQKQLQILGLFNLT
ncbi:hypothetical protein [Desulfolucanica intricata]|uniref:hypothetical protein n=1 Tax=Desulfolucanica intricata TaxID=1285191 RepID=UPI000832A6BD|nr:hypothetical protein [Desulfolucanica intricata]